MEKLFSIVDWVDENTSSVIGLQCITRPRKEFDEYGIGDEVFAKYEGREYKAVISSFGSTRSDLNKLLLAPQKNKSLPTVTSITKSPQVKNKRKSQEHDSATRSDLNKLVLAPQKNKSLPTVTLTTKSPQVKNKRKSQEHDSDGAVLQLNVNKTQNGELAKKLKEQKQRMRMDNITTLQNLVVLDDHDTIFPTHLNAKGHPLVAEKQPRTQFRQLGNNVDPPTCRKCTELRDEVEALKEETNALRQELEICSNKAQAQVDSLLARPRSGVFTSEEAEKLQMVPLVQGVEVYLYRDEMNRARNKCLVQPTQMAMKYKERDSRPAARYLLSVFFSQEDLAFGTLDAKSTSFRTLNPVVVHAIKAFCLANSPCRDSEIRQALASKITGLRSRLRSQNGKILAA